MLHGVYPEPSVEILRFAQNDRSEGLAMTKYNSSLRGRIDRSNLRVQFHLFLLNFVTTTKSNGISITAKSATAVGVFCRAPMEQPPPPPVGTTGSAGVVADASFE